jgi:carbamoyltransferase
MIILGIHDGHNAAAALVKDGRVLAALQEERLRNEKNWSGFPALAIEELFNLTGLSIRDVDRVAYNGYHIHPPFTRDQDLQGRRDNAGWYGRAMHLIRKTPIMGAYRGRRREARLRAAMGLGLPKEKIHFTEHHTAHAAAAYYGWGRYERPVLVLTADGAGDELSATVSIGREGRLERLAAVGRDDSLGTVYSTITFLMGMVPLEHEYKLMGLAPYAEPKRAAQVADILFDYMPLPKGLTWERKPGRPPAPLMYSYLRQKLELHRFDSIAAGVQLYLEEMLLAWVRAAIKSTGVHHLALSGGVFMNVKANKRILELPEVEGLFVFPSCGDETNAVGAAYWQEAEFGPTRQLPPVGDLYWGGDFDPAAARAAVEKLSAGQAWKIQYFPDDSIDLEIARLLAEGEIVARARGRMEFGARALGNRSILADPTLPKVVNTINYMVKNRDFWMPFAPMILEERAGDYLVNPKNIPAPHMILSFDSQPARRDELTAALHPYDQTARPQVLMAAHNPAMHRLLLRFQELTGRGAVLNTSFNLHGYPIVGTPEAAIEVFMKSGLPHLAVGDCLLSKVGSI